MSTMTGMNAAKRKLIDMAMASLATLKSDRDVDDYEALVAAENGTDEEIETALAVAKRRLAAKTAEAVIEQMLEALHVACGRYESLEYFSETADPEDRDEAELIEAAIAAAQTFQATRPDQP